MNAAGKPLAHVVGSLKGKYVVCYEDKDRDLQSVEVPVNWAENQFGVTALAYAQRLAYSVHENDSFKGEDGQNYNLHRYVDVKLSGATVQLDNFEINKLKFQPAKKVYNGHYYKRDKDGKEITVDGQRIKVP